MEFESLLSARLAVVLSASGCVLFPPKTGDCDNPPAGVVTVEGYVAVEPGAECPDASEAGPLETVDCCPVYIYQGVNCGYVRREEGVELRDYTYSYGATTLPDPMPPQSDTGTATYYTPSDTATSGLVDLCFYEGLFEETGTCCGRPLLEGGQAVVARVGRGSAWSGPQRADVSGLSAEARRRVGEHWLRSALMEHASVASFARVTLDLMRLGAPPALLADVHRAGLDEIEHARLCFAIASAALGEELAPGALPLGGDGAVDRTAFAEALVREGCVGETLAALDAAARLRRATDPAVRAALEAIVADESRHAALAWRILGWLLDGDASGALRRHLAAVFDDERARLPVPAPGVDVPSHGVISETEVAAELRAGWERVVAPAWEAACTA